MSVIEVGQADLEHKRQQSEIDIAEVEEILKTNSGDYNH